MKQMGWLINSLDSGVLTVSGARQPFCSGWDVCIHGPYSYHGQRQHRPQVDMFSGGLHSGRGMGSGLLKQDLVFQPPGTEHISIFW